MMDKSLKGMTVVWGPVLAFKDGYRYQFTVEQVATGLHRKILYESTPRKKRREADGIAK